MPISSSKSPLKQFKARVISNTGIVNIPGATYYLLEVVYPHTCTDCKPGQFFMLQCGDDVLLRRPISIHSTQPGKLHFLYAAPGGSQGTGTRLLALLKPNAEIDMIGPLGNGFSLDAAGKHTLIVAGGIGIAPLKYLAESALSAGHDVTILMGARSAGALYPSAMLPPGARAIITTDDGSAGIHAPVTSLLPDYVNQADGIYACGPVAMYHAMQATLNECHVNKPVQVSLEVRMGCGFGVCYGCSIKTRHGMQRVCREGPVFNIKDIIWQEVKI